MQWILAGPVIFVTLGLVIGGAADRLLTGQGPCQPFSPRACARKVEGTLAGCGCPSGSLRGSPSTGALVKIRGSIAAVTTAAALVLLAPGTASAAVGVDNASAFSSNGTSSGGWTWVHQDTDSASWTFNITSLQSAKQGTVYLNVDALVSNRVNGGSGYSASSVRFTAACGNVRQVLKVKLVNPFRPVFSGNSLGIGWAAAGHSSAPLRLTKFDGCSQITVTTGGPYAQERAIGFRQASLSLGYS